MSASDKKALVILLHGVGSNGADMAGLAPLLGAGRTDLAFEAPNAPTKADHPGGYQWFSIAGITPDNRPPRLVAARAGFDATISALVEKHGLTGRLDRVMLVGFSQGSIMALDAVASGRLPVAGVVAFSGRLATPLPLAPAVQTPVLILHGASDPMIPAAEGQAAAKRLAEAGVPVETHVFPGLAHTISREGADLAAAFIARRL